MKLHRLEPFDEENSTVTVVIETPSGSRNKYAWDEDESLFILDGVLPSGASFPFDFGFVPSTAGEGGDPLEILVLMDAPAFPGCVVHVRVVGLIEAEETVKDETSRNDRVIGVAAESQLYRDVQELDDLAEPILEAMSRFFVSYHELRGKVFTPLGRFGPARGLAAVQQGIQQARKKRKR